MTVAFPLAVINQLDEQVFDWLVPGLIREKITLLLRALPKAIRKQFVPVPDTVTAFLEQTEYRDGDLIEQLNEFLKARLSFTMQNELQHELSENPDYKQKMPEHLTMNFKIIDNEGHELDSSRNLSLLKKNWAEKALQQLDDVIEESIERQDIECWDFDVLPEQIELERHGMTIMLYPALYAQSEDKKLAIKLFDQKNIAQDNHAQGIVLLLKLMLSKELKTLQKQLPDIDKSCLLYTPYGSCSDLKADMLDGILVNTVEEVIATHHLNDEKKLSAIRDKVIFSELLLAVKAALEKNKQEVAQAVLNVLQANQLLSRQLKGNIPFNLLNTLADIKMQQNHLVFKGFIAQTPLRWLKRMPRYFKGMMIRIEKAGHDYRRDALNQGLLIPLWENFEKKQRQLKSAKNSTGKLFFSHPQLVEYRWLIEELRISLFAQELKTSQPVSVKRLEKKWQAVI